MQPASNKYLILKRAMKQIGRKTSEFIQNDVVLVWNQSASVLDWLPAVLWWTQFSKSLMGTNGNSCNQSLMGYILLIYTYIYIILYVYIYIIYTTHMYSLMGTTFHGFLEISPQNCHQKTSPGAASGAAGGCHWEGWLVTGPWLDDFSIQFP